VLTQSEHPPRPSGPREGRLARHTGPTALMAAAAATTAALSTVPGPVPLLIVLAVAAGTVSDNITLLPATAVTDCWETAHYARLSILLAATATGSHRTRSSQCAQRLGAWDNGAQGAGARAAARLPARGPGRADGLRAR
jgi:hypothetical protein